MHCDAPTASTCSGRARRCRCHRTGPRRELTRVRWNGRPNLTASPARVSFIDRAWEYLAGAPGEQWSWSFVPYRARTAANGRTTYLVVNSDLQRGADFLRVTLPAAPRPFSGAGSTGSSGPHRNDGGAGASPDGAGNGLADTGGTALPGVAGVALLAAAAALTGWRRRRPSHQRTLVEFTARR